jgi:hypothetical protein
MSSPSPNPSTVRYTSAVPVLPDRSGRPTFAVSGLHDSAVPGLTDHTVPGLTDHTVPVLPDRSGHPTFAVPGLTDHTVPSTSVRPTSVRPASAAPKLYDSSHTGQNNVPQNLKNIAVNVDKHVIFPIASFFGFDIDKYTNDDDIAEANAVLDADKKRKEVEADKAVKKILESIKREENNKQVEKNLLKLFEKVECIEYSIKKLELDMRLTNEDSIGNLEFDALLKEIEVLKDKINPNTCFERILIDDFKASARMKRNINSYSVIIKLASFICPMLAIANKNSLLNLSHLATIQEEDIVKTKNICNTMMITMMNMASIENGDTLEVIGSALDNIQKAQDAGVIDAIYNAVGITASAGNIIGEKIKEIYEYYIRTNTIIITFLKIASKPQRIIATASLILFIMFTLLNVVEGNYTVLLKKIDESSRFQKVLGGAKKIKYKSKSTKPTKTPKALAKPTKTPKALAKPAKTPKALAKPAKTPKALAKPAKTPKVAQKKKK